MHRPLRIDLLGYQSLGYRSLGYRSLGISLLAIFLTTTCFWQTAAAQHPPQYRVLRAPTSPTPYHPPMRGVREAYVQPTMRRSYAYGWFGAQGSPQWSRHFGYYRNYTQWSRR